MSSTPSTDTASEDVSRIGVSASWDDDVRTNPQTDKTYRVTSWASIDLEPIKSGAITMPQPMFLKRTDGAAMIYPGLPHVFFGPSESLKSWAAVLASASFIAAGYAVVYVDFEGSEAAFVERARIVGVPEHAIGNALRYTRPTEPLKGNVNAAADLGMDLSALNPGLVVLDGVSECYALHGWNINDATDAANFQKLFRPINENGAATIVIDHAGKDASRGVVGSQHKRAGLDGAEYEFTPKRREGRGGHSEASIRVTKDRYGYIREYAPHGGMGRIHVSDIVEIRPPNEAQEYGLDEGLYESLLTWIEANPGQSTRVIRLNVLGSATAIGNALEVLEADGKVRSEAGPRNAKLWFSGSEVENHS
jgi:hypothetical protein